MDNIRIDVAYAVRQLERAKRRQWTGQGCMDALDRALDALERVEERLAICKNCNQGPCVCDEIQTMLFERGADSGLTENDLWEAKPILNAVWALTDEGGLQEARETFAKKFNLQPCVHKDRIAEVQRIH